VTRSRTTAKQAGAEGVADPVLVEATVQHAYLTLRQESGSTPILVNVNSLLSDVPDLVLVFGSDKLTERAVEGARRGQIRVVQIAETEDAE